MDFSYKTLDDNNLTFYKTILAVIFKTNQTKLTQLNARNKIIKSLRKYKIFIKL